MNAFLNKYGDMLRWWLTAIMIAGLYFLNHSFVSLERYEADKTATDVARRVETDKVDSRLDGIEKAIVLMTEQNKQLADHETRIRALESKR